MNKSDLITKMTERLDGDRTAAVAAVDGVLAEIQGGVARGERVSLTGFGTFEGRHRAARTARNPRTGETVQVGEAVIPVFRAGTGFRALLSRDGAPASAVTEDGAPAAEPTPVADTRAADAQATETAATEPETAAVETEVAGPEVAETVAVAAPAGRASGAKAGKAAKAKAKAARASAVELDKGKLGKVKLDRTKLGKGKPEKAKAGKKAGKGAR
ncbi:HU family DNA-binding protein [Blastococcus sp. SYSU D00695]